MVPGHTKFKCDGSFGLIKKLYRKTTVDCVDHIVEVVKRSSTAGLNKAQCYDNGKGFQYLQWVIKSIRHSLKFTSKTYEKSLFLKIYPAHVYYANCNSFCMVQKLIDCAFREK